MDKKKILIVDDEEQIRVLLNRILETEYTVLQAKNGQEAVDQAKKNKPDLILMDILMPVVDGYTACSKIKTDPVTHTIPVVMLTAVGFPLNKQLAMRVRADGYLTKPFVKEELVKIIGQFILNV